MRHHFPAGTPSRSCRQWTRRLTCRRSPEAVATAMRTSMGGDGTVEVFSSAAPIVLRRSNADDSVTHTIYVLHAGSGDAGAVVFANGTRAIDLCGRGTTTLDGATVCVDRTNWARSVSNSVTIRAQIRRAQLCHAEPAITSTV